MTDGPPPGPPPHAPGSYSPGPDGPPPVSAGRRRSGLFLGLAVLVVVLVVIGVVALAALTGGEDGVDPEEYATDVCGALGDWRDELQDESVDLQDDLQTNDVEEVQDVLVGFLDGAVDRTEVLLRDIEGFGFPQGDRGEELAADFRTSLSQARDLFGAAADDARELDPDDPSSFAEGAERVGEDLSEGGRKVEEDFDALEEEYEGSEVSEALSESDACDDLENRA